ncbi:MAG: DUF421 domain-containing protein [Clostridia bacterium]|jgi:uncharacterized membrane protein YcaP (DUF421 family)|nr:DUF421 domain-containing protein [Clostridia bacterium]
MLVVFIKSIITFFLVLLVVRLMGKRQLGEMQPFELVITFIIAEVACIPMNDPYIPFYYGIIPILTLGLLHIVVSFLARKSLVVRRLLSGRSLIVVDPDGIVYDNLKKMNLNVNDLIEAIRSAGYMDISEIEYAIFETNGKLCVVEKAADPTAVKPAFLPLPLVIDGKFAMDNLELSGTTVPMLTQAVKKNRLSGIKDVLYADVRQDGTVYISPKKGKCFTEKLAISGGGNW